MKSLGSFLWFMLSGAEGRFQFRDHWEVSMGQEKPGHGQTRGVADPGSCRRHRRAYMGQ